MAVTKIIPIHIGNNNNAVKNIIASTDYILNLNKTNNGELVSSFECDPKTVASEFLLSRREYFQKTGRKPKNDILGYHFIQSFKPGEITSEEANRIGYETASRLLKGNHAFIVTTHIDTDHIHNHIIWNSISVDCKKKFRNFIKSYFHIRRLSDLICIENKLSVITQLSKNQINYDWKSHPKRTSNREIIRADIDFILKDSPKSFNEFLSALSSLGYEIKQGKNISLRKQGQKKFARLSSLGDNYSEEFIKLIIKGSKKRVSQLQPEKPDLLIDIEKKISEGKGIGYQKFAESFNMKQLSKSVLYVQEKGFNSIEEFSEYVNKTKTRIDELQNEIDKCNARMDEISELKNHIIAYAKYSKIFAEYKKRRYSKDFFEEHKEEIQYYKNAKRFFDTQEFPDNKLPSVASLKKEFDEKRADKNSSYDEIILLRKEFREMLIHQKNTESILLPHDEKTSSQNKKKKTEPEH